jgi:hypothetical protein
MGRPAERAFLNASPQARRLWYTRLLYEAAGFVEARDSFYRLRGLSHDKMPFLNPVIFSQK